MTPNATLTGKPKEILRAYTDVSGGTRASASGDIRSSNPYVSYFAIRRADREGVIGREQVLELLRSREPLQRASAAAAAGRVFGPDVAAPLAPFLSDAHPGAAEAAFESITTAGLPSKAAAALLDAFPRLPAALRHRAMAFFGKTRHRAAVAKLEELFSRRDAVDAPAACRALAAIQGRGFTESLPEYLQPDNPLELHAAILECMADQPAPVFFSKSAQLLKSARNKAFSIEIIRRIALWSSQGRDFATALLGNSDPDIADAAQEGIVRQLGESGCLPPGFLQNLTKTSFDRESSYAAPARMYLPDHLESMDKALSVAFQSKPDSDFQQLFHMVLSAEKHFLKPKMVQLAEARWGLPLAKIVEAALSLAPPDASLLKMRLQSRAAKETEQQSRAVRLARMIECVGQSRLKATSKEIVRHLDTPSLPIQLAAVDALAAIGGQSDVPEIEKRLPGAHWMLRRRMAQALARISRDRPSAGLFRLCHDEEPLVRISAVRSLEWVRDEETYRILIASLGDADERVRSAACACLRIYPGRKEVLAGLAEKLEDTDARVRANTVESLEILMAQDPGGLRRLIEPRLRDPNARVVINAAKALFPIDPDLSMPILESYLRAPDSNLRAGALWALGQLKRPDAFLTLFVHALSEKDEYVRTFVDRGFKLMEDHPFYRDARFLLADPKLSENPSPGGHR